MKHTKVCETQQTPFLQLESQIQHLQVELTSSNLSNKARESLRHRLAAANEQFKDTVAGRNSAQHLERVIDEIDFELAQAVIEQAEHEIPKQKQSDSKFQAIEHIKAQLVSGNITTTKARRDVKNIMRHD
ncbi:MAG: hypothetical protein JSS62_00575 [Verrucomicrobia bacterium]|nr:hypothetical protein [Verrucomicrobiota bacterium]MBS0646627.1 hypothetical protein [Verrucomicrobiota bacterium]